MSKKLLKIFKIMINENSDVQYSWIGIDKNGEVFAFESKPEYDSIRRCYDLNMEISNWNRYTKICDIGIQFKASLYKL